jgi:hypothetical protein
MRYLFFILVVVAALFTGCHRSVTTPVNTQSEGTNISAGGAVITENEAKDHIGEDAVVSGTVLGLYINSQNTNVYLYFDSDIFHPKFAVVWPGSNDPPVKLLRDFILKNKTISVSGKIITESNVPEIIVGSWAQIN